MQFWDLGPTSDHRSLALEPRSARALGFSPDGRRFAVTSYVDRSLRIWDWPILGEPVMRIPGDPCVFAFAPGGGNIATGSSDGTIQIREVASGRLLAESKAHEGPVLSLAYSPDGQTLATGAVDDPVVLLWDARSNRPRATLRGHVGRHVALAFCPDGSLLATADWDGMIHLWDPDSGRELASMSADSGWLKALAFSPDNRTLATGGHDGSIRLWDVRKIIAG